MKNIFKKENISTIILVLLLTVASSYIFWDIFAKTKDRYIKDGYVKAVSEIMNQAENEKCEPFSVFLDDKELFLLNTDCLK